jgi:tetratricopeptide (TPR) repeat protein
VKLLPIILTLVFINSALSQEYHKQNKRLIKLWARVRDVSEIIERQLYVTTDNGKTWARAKPVEWEDKDAIIIARYTVKKDGLYGFDFRFKDIHGHIPPPPASGQKPLLKVLVDTQPPKISKIKKLFEFVKTNQIKIFYHTQDRCEIKAVRLWAMLPGEKKWKRITDVLFGTATNGEKFIVYRPTKKGRYKFKLQAIDELGNKIGDPTPQTPPDIEVEVPVEAPIPVILRPKDIREVCPFQIIRIQWETPEDKFEKDSANVLYTYEGENWIVIKKGLPLTGVLEWAVPDRVGKMFKLKVTVTDEAGDRVASQPTNWIKIVEKPKVINWAKAKGHYTRGRVFLAQLKWVEAEREFKTALRYAPLYFDALNDLGRTYYRMRRFHDALEYFNRAKEANPSSPLAYINASMVYIRMKEHENALNDLKISVDLGVEAKAEWASITATRLVHVAQAFYNAKKFEHAKKASQLVLKIKGVNRGLINTAREILGRIPKK